MVISPQTSPLQITRQRQLPNGMGESNHLSQFFMTEPERLESVLSFGFGLNRSESILTMLTGALKNTRFISNRQFQWDLHGQADRTFAITRSLSGTTIGQNNSPFYLYFSEDVFGDGDVLVGENGKQVIVQGRGHQDGNETRYSCKIFSNVSVMDEKYLKTGKRFSREYNAHGEYSIKGTTTQTSTPARLMNQLTTIRHTYSATRSAATDVMVMDVSLGDGAKTKMWAKWQEWNALREWKMEQDRLLLYSEMAEGPTAMTQVKDEQGQRAIYRGAGMLQQISPANVRYYYRLTYEVLDSFLRDLSYAANEEGGQVNFVAFTGKMGMAEFDRAIKEYNKGNNITVTNSGTFITGTGDNLTLKGHFKTVEFLSGITLTVREFPPYDDMNNARNFAKHPRSGRPLQSYEFTIVNFGTTAKGVPNIRKVAKADSESLMWYVAGSTDPFKGVLKGYSKTNMSASGIDGYEVHFLAEIGLQVEDPTSCGRLIMASDV